VQVSVTRFTHIDQKELLEEGIDGHRKAQRQNLHTFVKIINKPCRDELD
jgi:hypothetical protein